MENCDVTSHAENDSKQEKVTSSQQIKNVKTLLSAMNLISRNVPLPPHLLDHLNSVYSSTQSNNACESGGSEMEHSMQSKHESEPNPEDFEGSEEKSALEDGEGAPPTGSLISDFEDAVANHKNYFMTGADLRRRKEERFKRYLASRLNELKELPSKRGEELQTKCLIELLGLKLIDLQRKVRSRVSAEYRLREECSSPDKHLFDWGLMRLQRPLPLSGVGDAVAAEADERQRKRRDAERQSRLEEMQRNNMETRKRKFFNELLNAAREFQLQGQAALKRRKQRNDGVQAWHARQRQRATRAEKLRFQALKADDQEAYMRLVEESKNERLKTLLEKTNELLVSLGAAVQKQKDAEHAGDNVATEEASNEATANVIDDDLDCEAGSNKSDLLQGQRQYNSVVHKIQETVTEQPTILVGGELRPYQLEGLQWMLSLFNNNLNGILADEMGLGKTIQTIALIAYLMEKKGVSGPHLIIAPKAVLPNWDHEFRSWAPSLKTLLYDGNLETRKGLSDQVQEATYNVLLTHYDYIIRDKSVLRKVHWHYLIIDEGHRLKNNESVLGKILNTCYHFRRRLLLTGTPIQNTIAELWALLHFLLPTIFNSYENFEEWFNAPFAERCDMAITDEEQLLIIRRLHQVIRPFLLRRKKDEVEKFLPSKTQVILKCDLSAWQKVYYQQITDVGRVGLDTGAGRPRTLQNLTMQLRKCCNHPYLFLDDYNMYRKEEIVRASGKFELLDRLLPKLHRSGHRVLLFSQMTRLMDILEIYLNLHCFKYLRLDGTTKTEERGTLLQKFNDPQSPYFMFLLSTRAGGLGLNLQSADTVILFDSDWNPQMDQQAEDRAHRIGQKKEVRVFVLVSVGSIEEEILDRAQQKMGIDAKVIQAGLFNTTSTAQDRREMLEEIMRRGTNSLGTDVPSEREINRLAARNDEEFWLFEKMDEERRQDEGYRSRLMEEHEVPDWVFSVHKGKDEKTGKDLSELVSGKRRRKEVIYTDILSESQWMKAVEDGLDVTQMAKEQLEKRTNKKKAKLSDTDQGDNDVETENEKALETEEDSMESKHSKKRKDREHDPNHAVDVKEFEQSYSNINTDLFSRVPKKLKSSKSKKKDTSDDNEENMNVLENETEQIGTFSNPGPLSWKPLKKKRSSYGHPPPGNR
eukprot:TRINITY_DN7867_c0_g1_i1.p1 TRINITY_DN7867_c0_g1~~TRINITY_DN7867_c0_g1_i1.p1  ORF type:complete len:1150 (+),score=277.75 TRINITY_DN7867_c0_g1_i1:156-3605(+)